MVIFNVSIRRLWKTILFVSKILIQTEKKQEQNPCPKYICFHLWTNIGSIKTILIDYLLKQEMHQYLDKMLKIREFR